MEDGCFHYVAIYLQANLRSSSSAMQHKARSAHQDYWKQAINPSLIIAFRTSSSCLKAIFDK